MTPTPPSTSHSNQSTQSFGVGKTPVNLHQPEHQKKKITSFEQHVVSPSVIDKAMEKVIKGAEMTMQNALLLQQHNHQLQTENQHRRKRKERARHFIQDGGNNRRKSKEESWKEMLNLSHLGHAGHRSAVIVVFLAIIDASVLVDNLYRRIIKYSGGCCCCWLSRQRIRRIRSIRRRSVVDYVILGNRGLTAIPHPY